MGLHGPTLSPEWSYSMEWVKRLLGRASQRDVPATEVEAIRPPRYAFSDPSVRIAAIGDTHGRSDLLQRLGLLLDRFAGDPQRRLIEIYLGDYVDRGPNPKGVIDYLIERSARTDRQVICLAGNHETMLLDALEDDEQFLGWLQLGGETTLRSYGVPIGKKRGDVTIARDAMAAALPPAHRQFLASLPTYFAHGGFYFVHAGVRPGIQLDQQKSRDLLWIREPFLSTSASFGATVVHGHTPSARPVFRLNRIGIDTGAYQTGLLTCLMITSEGVATTDTQRLVGADPV